MNRRPSFPAPAASPRAGTRRILLAAAPLAALAATLWAAPPVRAVELKQVDLAQSSVNFQFKEMGVAIDGSFRRFSVQLAFDPARPASAKAAINLELASIDAGSDDANDEVTGKLWFNTRSYPQAVFSSTAVRPLGGNRFEVIGKLTIKGRTQDVTAPFTYTPQGAKGVFDGSFVIRRADFAVGEGEWADFGTVANEIPVKFHFLAGAGN